MGNIHYMISEAAKEVGVESHVLRYWEEEMELKIGRTEMGHRYYTEEDIRLFQCIRKLKDEGVLLKELKLLVPELQQVKKVKKIESDKSGDHQNLVRKIQDKKKDRNIDIILEQALKKNNLELEQSICQLVTVSMKKEMSYLLDAKEQLEEDRYRRLDTLIRQQQALRKEQSKRTLPFFVKHVFGT